MPDISVIIPLYNKCFHIRDTLNSVLTQTFQNFEIIVIDGGSTDGSQDIVREIHDPRILLIQQVSQGVSGARNEGVNASSSELIAFLDADDIWTTCHLEELLRLRSNFPTAGIYGTQYHYITETGREKKPYIKYIPKYPWNGLLSHYFLTIACGEPPFITSTVAVPKRIFIEFGGFLPQWNWAEDIELWGRIALRYPIAFSWKCGTYWHHDAENRLGHLTPPLEIQPLYTTIHDHLSKNSVDAKQLTEIREFLAALEIDFSIRLYQAGNYDRATEVLRQSRPTLLLYRKIMWMMIFLLPKPFYIFLRFIKTNF